MRCICFLYLISAFGRVIQTLVSEVIVNIGALYKASEAVAMVDMLWSLAHAAICECILLRPLCRFSSS